MSERRRRSLFAAVVADPWRKLLAIALAVMAWFFIDSRINKEVERSLPLVAVGEQVSRGAASNQLAVAIPTDQVRALRFYDGEREVREVAVVIRGQRFRIDALEREPWDLQITDFLRLDWSVRNSVEFTAADLPRDHRLLRDLEITFRPIRIRLDVEQVQKQEFPLALEAVDLVDGPFASRLRRDTAEFSPTVATVLGPPESVKKFVARTGRRFRATLGAGTNDRQVQAKLELLADDAPGLRFQTTPSLTMQLLPQTTRFVLELPVLVDDLALPPELRGRYQPETPTRTVQIAAGGELLSRLVAAGEGERGEAARAVWAAANLHLYVGVLRSDSGSYPPELDRPARLFIVERRLAEAVDRNECLLGEQVVVKLRQKS